MWAEINGERKKVACGPCIRGHRSSKCDHRDRVLIEVRKPGRPLSSCPHPSASECACPSDRAQPLTAVSGISSRVQKSRNRKSISSLTPSTIEKAIRASQEVDAESSSLGTSTTPTNPSFAPSDRSASNGASPPSSASSTPRITSSASLKPSYPSDAQLTDTQSQPVSDCCKPKTVREQEPRQQQGGSCCSNKSKEPQKPVQTKKSCYSEPSQPERVELVNQTQANNDQNARNHAQFQQHGQLQNQALGMVNPGFSFMSNMPSNLPANMAMLMPFGFNTPIYNHMAQLYQQSASVPMPPMPNGNGHNVPEHNCHCGDSCSCFGCAAHPHNATMTEYLRLMHQYMSTGGFGAIPPPTYDLPSYPHHPGFGPGVSQNLAFNNHSGTASFTNVSASQALSASVDPIVNVASFPPNVSGPWPQECIHASARTSTMSNGQSCNPSNIHRETSPDKKQEEPAPSPIFVDSPSEGNNEDTPTLSPSAYLWQELELPGCTDATGTCQCGDGCACVGCLTHGGHNGVPLDAPATSDSETFTTYITSNDGTQAEFATDPFLDTPN
ncbi:hypothetical protein CC78DRAFT_539821 [Lojkania enalia]|uniref:Copper-fist domain-containing protein n=1 Tax=Lojkania enalia TaxID=147567 RepID=A0A9P4NAY0_9PLEO|nr:hypothetical protein CC78DRAFT_539821 [Didymosphaeria enalia]